MGNEAERLAALEAQLTDIKQALIRLDTKLDTWQSTYVPRAEINEMFRSRDARINDVYDELGRLDVNSRERRTLIPTWANVLIAVGSLAVAVIAVVVSLH